MASADAFVDLSELKVATAEVIYPRHVTVTASAIPDPSGSFSFLSLGPHAFQVDASGIRTESGQRPSLGSSSLHPAFSPQHLIREGITRSDWYYIQRGSNLYYLYCDLTTEGPSGERGHILFLSFKGNGYNYRNNMGNEEYVITTDKTVPFPVGQSNKYKIALSATDFPNLRYVAMTIDDTAYQFSYPYWAATSTGVRYFKHIMNIDPSGVNASVSEPFQYWVRNTGFYIAGGVQHFGLRYSDSNSFQTVQIQTSTSNGIGTYGANSTMYMIQGIPQSNNFSTWVLSTNTNTPWSGANTNGEWGAYNSNSTRGFGNAWGWNGAAIYAFAYFTEPTVSPIVVRPSSWVQYSIVYDASGIVNYYADGILFATKGVGASMTPTSVTLRGGKFRRVALYDRVMTQEHLRAISRFPDLNSFSYHSLGSSTNPVSSPQDLVRNGIMNSGTHWLDISGNAKAHYLNLDINARKGYVLLSATDASDGWNAFTSNRLLSMSVNGVYSLTGTIGRYSIDYNVLTYGISHLLLVTGNGQFWMEFPVEYLRDATSTFTTRTITGGILPTGQQTMGIRLDGTVVRIYADSTQNATRCLWADGGLASETTMKTSFGGVYMYGHMGNVTSVSNQLVPYVFGSRANPVLYTDIPMGSNQILWVANSKDASVQPLEIWSSPSCHGNEPFALVGASKSTGNWGPYDSGNGSLTDNLRGNVLYGNYLQGDYLIKFGVYHFNKYLFMTEDKEFWFTISVKDFENIGTSTGVRTVGILQKSSNLPQMAAYIRFDGLPSSPFISLTSDFSNYVFWGENESSYGTTFKNLHGGIQLYIGGKVSIGFDETSPISSVSQLITQGNVSDGFYWISVNGISKRWYHNLTWNQSVGYTHVGFAQRWHVNSNDILRGLVNVDKDASTNEFFHAFQGVPFTTFLFRTRNGLHFYEVFKDSIFQAINIKDSGAQGIIPLVSSSDPLVSSAFIKVENNSWTLCPGTQFDASRVFWASLGSTVWIQANGGIDLYIGRAPEPSARYWRVALTGRTTYAFEELSLYSSRTDGPLTLSNHPPKEALSVSIVTGTVMSGSDIDWLINGAYTFENPVQLSGSTIVLEYDFGTVKEIAQLIMSPNESCMVQLSYSNDRVNWTSGTALNVTPSTMYECMVYQKIRLDTWRYVYSFRGFNESQLYLPPDDGPIELEATLSRPTQLSLVQVIKDTSSIFPVPSMVLYGSNDDEDYQYITTISNSLPRMVEYPKETKERATLVSKAYDSWNFALSKYSQYYHQPVLGTNLVTTAMGLKDSGYAYSIEIPNNIQTIEFEYRLQTLTGQRQLVSITNVLTLSLNNGLLYVSNLLFGLSTPTAIFLSLDADTLYRFVITWTSTLLRIYANGALCFQKKNG